MAERVIVHVGTPKSGTTYLQGMLWQNREHLAEAGVELPLERRRDHNQACGDLSGNISLVLPGVEPVTWDDLAAGIKACTGTAIVSEEMLSGLREDARIRLVESIGADRLHIVVTGRDAVRQVPSMWQQTLKHGKCATLERYAADVASGTQPYWGRQQDLGRILGAWCEHLPADQVHLVTVPPSRAEPGLLWERFAQVLGIDPAGFDAHEEAANTTLDSVQAEVLRRVNQLLDGRLPYPDPYFPVVRATMVPLLAGHVLGHRITIPQAQVAWALGEGRRYIEQAEALGIDVVGDLDELAGRDPGQPPAVEIPADVLAEVVLATLADMAVAQADAAKALGVCRGRLQTARNRLEKARARNRRLTSRIKELQEPGAVGGLRRRLRRR